MAEFSSGFPKGERAGGLSSGNLETTELFVDGINTARIQRVVTVLRPMLQKLRPAPEVRVVARHRRKNASDLPHEGWRVERMLFERPIQMKDGAMSEEARGYALFVPIEGGLHVCASDSESEESRDIDLTSHQIDQYDYLLHGRHASSNVVPEEARLFNAVAIGNILTKFTETYGILEQARDYAVDPPMPGQMMY